MLTTLPLILAGGVAAQGLPPASVDEIMAGAKSCLAATSSAGVDENKLRGDGWKHGTMSDKGKPVDNGLSIYGRDGLLMILHGSKPGSLCLFTARIASPSDIAKLQASMAAAYGKPASDDGKGEQMFFTADNHIVDVASTGSQDQPAVRVAVGPVSQEKK